VRQSRRATRRTAGRPSGNIGTGADADTFAGRAQSLAFSAPQVGGGTIDMAAYAGQPVLLWFWAPT
jgi:hypothetical protein